MEPKFISVFVAAIIPLIMGFIWYHPKFLGTTWMREAGLTEDDMKNFNMVKVFGLTYVFSVLLGMTLMPMVIHQMGFFSTLANEPGLMDPATEMGAYFKNFMEKYGNNFRTFKHGAFHGTLAGILFILPITAVNGMFERKSWKYIFINAGFWTVSACLMGGVICAWK